jgi:hypothetical protein
MPFFSVLGKGGLSERKLDHGAWRAKGRRAPAIEVVRPREHGFDVPIHTLLESSLNRARARILAGPSGAAHTLFAMLVAERRFAGHRGGLAAA